MVESSEADALTAAADGLSPWDEDATALPVPRPPQQQRPPSIRLMSSASRASKSPGRPPSSASYKGHSRRKSPKAASPSTAGKKLKPLRKLPTPPIFILVDGMHQKEGIVHMRARMHLRIVNQDKLESPVEDADFVMSHVSGPMPLDFEIHALGTPGVFRVEYSARMAGLYSFQVTCRGRRMHRRAEPLSIQVSKPVTSAANCVAKGAALRSGVAGIKGTFEILARDQLGYLRNHCPEQFSMDITGPAKCHHASIGEFHDGRLPANYMITRAGMYKVGISLGRTPIGDSPYYLQIHGGEPCLERTRPVLCPLLPGSRKFRMRAGEPGHVGVCCYDEFGNLNSAGRCELRLALLHAQSGGGTLHGRLTSHRKGTYDFEFRPNAAGRYFLQGKLKVGGEWQPLAHINDMVEVGAGRLDPTACFICSETAAGNMGVSATSVAGEWVEFSMQGVDLFGNCSDERVLDSATLKVASHSVESLDLHSDIDANDSVEQEVEPQDDGTVVFRYRVRVAGRYVCQVLVRGTPIRDSARFFTYFYPGEMEPSQCAVTTSGFEDSLVGVCATVTVEVRDKFGNRLGHGGHGLEASGMPVRAVEGAKGPSALTSSILADTGMGSSIGNSSVLPPEVTVTDDDSGRYLVTILPKEPGLHRINLTYKHQHAHTQMDRPITDAPITLHVGTASTMAKGVTIPGEAFKVAVAGQRQSFTFWSLESSSNTRKAKGGERFALLLAMLPGASRQAILAKEAEQGERKRNSKTEALGRHKSMRIPPAKQRGSPRKANATAKAGPGRAMSVRMPKQNPLTPSDRRQEDSNCDDDENDVTINASVTDNDDGSYTVAYTPEVAGVYLMRISRNGIPISYSESRTLVHVHPTDLHGPSTLLYGPGLRQAEVGAPAVFYMQLCDRFRNMVSDEAGKYRFEVDIYKEYVPADQEEDTLLEANMTDRGAGQHEVRYSAKEAGSYVMEIRLNGKVVEELERRVVFVPTATDPGKCEISGLWLRRAVAGYVGQLSIKTRDRFGNERRSGGDSFGATLQLLSPAPGLNQELPIGALKLKAVDIRDGSYEIFFRTKVAGQYLLLINYANDPISKTLVYEGKLDVMQDVSHADRCIATGPGLSSPAANVSAKVHMVVHDRYGNCTPLDYEPPAELLRRGQDLHGTVSSWQKGRARVRQPALGMQALVAEVEQLEAEQGGKARPGRGSESGSDGDSSIGSDGSNDLGSDSSKAGDSKHALTKGSKGYLGLVATLNSADADEFVKTVCTVAKASDLAVTTEAIQGRSSIGVEEGPDSPRAVEGESSYVIKFTPPRAGLFMLEVVLRGKHILGSPYRIQAHEEHVLGAFSGQGGAELDCFAEQALMFASMQRTQGVRVYNRQLGDPTTSGHIASVDVSSIKSSVWDASTSSLIKQVGLNPTVTTAAARIAELQQLSRYEMRKQSALMHLRIDNLKHAFGESADGAELRRRHAGAVPEEEGEGEGEGTRPLPRVSEQVGPPPKEQQRLGVGLAPPGGSFVDHLSALLDEAGRL